MTASFRNITLDTGDGDDEGVLVLQDNRLVAVLSHLGAMHGDIAGQWFVEAMFGNQLLKPRHTFADPKDFVAWLEVEGCSSAPDA